MRPYIQVLLQKKQQLHFTEFSKIESQTYLNIETPVYCARESVDRVKNVEFCIILRTYILGHDSNENTSAGDMKIRTQFVVSKTNNFPNQR